MLHGVTIEPVRLTRWDERLQARAVFVTGYRFRCTCGELGSRRGCMGDARLDGREHVARARGTSP